VAENKTRSTKASVADFLKKKATGQQLADSQELIRLFSDITGSPPKMWGPSIVGFGSYHYVYESGREGDAPLLGFSPRKPEMVLYVMSCDGQDDVSKKLGKCRTGASCIYVKKLDDIDRKLLAQLARKSVADTRKRYPDRS
jgi:hypothetical protein